VPAKRKIIIGYGNAANYITFIGLLFALASCYFALNGNIRVSVILLIVSGVCDLFDGYVANRLTKRTDDAKQFGVQLDTVVDVISFGVTPAIIMYSITRDAQEWYMLAVYALYIICAVDRLAYFNTMKAPDTVMTHYRGLPVTSIAMILPLVLLFRQPLAGVAALGAVAVLFVLNVRIPKARGIWYGLFSILAVVMVAVWCLYSGYDI
jgi:CDP-diacylglycerol--serine O-phosphatidyltransferase